MNEQKRFVNFILASVIVLWVWSLFIAPKQAGFTVGKKMEKLGYKCIDSGELVFDDYRLTKEHLIGGVEGQGFFQATGGLELGRINVAARGVGTRAGHEHIGVHVGVGRRNLQLHVRYVGAARAGAQVLLERRRHVRPRRRRLYVR